MTHIAQVSRCKAAACFCSYFHISCHGNRVFTSLVSFLVLTFFCLFVPSLPIVNLISVICSQFSFLLVYFEFLHAFFLFLSLLLLALPPAFQSLPKANTWQNYLVGHSQVQTARGAKCLMPLPPKRRLKRIPKRSPKKGKIPNPRRIQSQKGKQKHTVHRSVLWRAPGSSVTEHTGQAVSLRHWDTCHSTGVWVTRSPGSWMVFGHPRPIGGQGHEFFGDCWHSM